MANPHEAPMIDNLDAFIRVLAAPKIEAEYVAMKKRIDAEPTQAAQIAALESVHTNLDIRHGEDQQRIAELERKLTDLVEAVKSSRVYTELYIPEGATKPTGHTLPKEENELLMALMRAATKEVRDG